MTTKKNPTKQEPNRRVGILLSEEMDNYFIEEMSKIKISKATLVLLALQEWMEYKKNIKHINSLSDQLQKIDGMKEMMDQVLSSKLKK